MDRLNIGWFNFRGYKIMKKINTQGVEIYTFSQNENDYISLTDIARYKNADFTADVVKNWMRNRSTIEFLGVWEQINNSNFKLVEFDGFKRDSGLNTFVLSPKKWIEKTNAIGLISRAGNGERYYCASKKIVKERCEYCICIRS